MKAVVAKLELGEGDAAIVYVTDAKVSTRSPRSRCPTPPTSSRRTPASSSRRRTNPDAAKAFLTWLAGPDGPGDPERVRVPAPVVTDLAAGGPGRPPRGAAGPPARPGTERAGAIAVSSRSPILFALFLGLPVLTLVGRAVLDGSLAIAAGSPQVLAALWLSLVTTAIAS